MSESAVTGDPDRAGPWIGALLALVSAAAAAGFAALVPTVSGGASVFATWDWAPALGVSLAFRIDGLSLVFALLITGFGAVISAYSAAYLRDHPHHTRFFLYLALFQAGMLGLVLADDVIALFVFWETTTVASFLLVGFEATAKARRAAWMALLITGAGGLALLAGLVWLAQIAGSTRISEITAAGGLGATPPICR
jgi:multicomponent Na+:H+ antiporter subunit A